MSRYLTKHYNSRGYPQTAKFHQQKYFVSHLERGYSEHVDHFKYLNRVFYSWYNFESKKYE